MSILTLPAIQAQMNFYGYLIVMVLGFFGNIFIIILFNQQRQNACAIYLMHSAITNQLYLAGAGLLKIFPVAYYDQTLGALLLCKFTGYISGFLGQVAKTILLLACIDRCLITSDQVRFRAFSTPKRAKYFIFFSYIFWLVAASHLLIWTTTSNGQCIKAGLYAIIFTFYAILLIGLIPSVILCVFGYLTYRHMKQLRRRIQPIGQNVNSVLQRRDRDLLVIVVSEAFLYIITTSLFPAALLESTITLYVMPYKSLQQTLAEIFTLNLALLLLYIYSAASFYIYMISSASFRRDFKRLIMNSYRKVIRQPPDQELRTAPKRTQYDTRI